MAVCRGIFLLYGPNLITSPRDWGYNISETRDLSYNEPMELKDFGEFKLIDRIKQKIESRGRSECCSVVVGIGDDGAIVRSLDGLQVVTTDTMVEDVHFSRSFGSWTDIGWKSMASNLSDIAAMAGVPTHSLITLGLPLNMKVESVEELYDGLIDCVNEFGGTIIGGDIVTSEKVFVTVTVFGALTGSLLCRKNAKVGDAIAVTGMLGGPAAALEIMKLGLEDKNGGVESLARVHMRVIPRISEAKLFAKKGVVCSMDISDGLIDDLRKLCMASNVSASLVCDQIPIHPLVRQAFPHDCLRFAANGGEDYELVLTASPDLLQSIESEFPNIITVVGKIEELSSEAVSILDKAGEPIKFVNGGWDHFLS